MKKTVIIGAGGLGREIYSALREKSLLSSSETEQYDCVCFLDDNPEALDGFGDYPKITGPVSNSMLDAQFAYVLGVGIPRVRRKVALLLKDSWNLFPTVWTLRSNLDEIIRPRGIALDCGSYINGRLSVNVSVGKFVLINYPHSIGHDVQIGDFCEIAPGSMISGGVKLDEGVFVGTGAIVGPGVQIGAWSKISAGAVVLEDVPPCSFVASPRCKVFQDFFLPYDEQNS